MTASGHERGAQGSRALVVVEPGMQRAAAVAETGRVDAVSAGMRLPHWSTAGEMPAACARGTPVYAHSTAAAGVVAQRRVPVAGVPTTRRMAVVDSFPASVRMLAAFLPFADLAALLGGELVALVVPAGAPAVVLAASAQPLREAPASSGRHLVAAVRMMAPTPRGPGHTVWVTSNRIVPLRCAVPPSSSSGSLCSVTIPVRYSPTEKMTSGRPSCRPEARRQSLIASMIRS